MSTQKQGHEYRANTLRFLARVGYASTRQVARAVWWKCTASTRRMASRTLGWLAERGLIVTRRDENSVAGEQLSAVSAAGATWLAEHGEPLPYGKAHARDWLRHAHSHRTACNSVYAATGGLFPDTSAWSELEIRASLAPMAQLTFTQDGTDIAKVPDVLIERHDGLVWVEVENTWRSDKDLVKMVAALRAMFHQPGRIREAWFVITSPGAKTIGQRLRKALTHGPESGWPRQVRETDARILERHLHVFILDGETLELLPEALCHKGQKSAV